MYSRHRVYIWTKNEEMNLFSNQKYIDNDSNKPKKTNY